MRVNECYGDFFASIRPNQGPYVADCALLEVIFARKPLGLELLSIDVWLRDRCCSGN
jgi:hypothetical protein